MDGFEGNPGIITIAGEWACAKTATVLALTMGTCACVLLVRCDSMAVAWASAVSSYLGVALLTPDRALLSVALLPRTRALSPPIPCLTASFHYPPRSHQPR